MKLCGYEIIKGRGIPFVDKKNVKIKGSEVGFSLMKIENILAMKQELHNQKIIERPTENTSMIQARSYNDKMIVNRDPLPVQFL